MSATVIDGKALAFSMREQIKNEVSKFTVAPGLAVVMVGDNPSSEIYVRNKRKACEEVGIISYHRHLPANATQEEVEGVVKELVACNGVDGILVQLPLPEGLDAEKILSLIPPEKDVDGFSELNVGNMLLGKSCLKACTPNGVIKLIKYAGVEIAGKHAVVIGRSNIVGKPAAVLLLEENATVTVCHSKTKNIKEICRLADIVVVAVGRAGFLTADMVKPGAVVIDVGTNRVDGKLVGDVDFDSVKEVAGYITPVPGGVGPMTITMLMYNTLIAYKRNKNIE
ncbi:MAG: bifunctional methylenetetrahydrofolate dehydrogenase/methenyltetrahydrofolate cyclohydrolase FolD [Clostridia bacterium]|nr:bifunctional methylenetetrahydrofolate dehydrogenase/methenyltetrahydrofolate cyclohydrolase FolD [Clostridia bacterium]